MPSILYGSEDDVCRMCTMPIEFHWEHDVIKIPMPNWFKKFELISEIDEPVPVDIMECHGFVTDDGTVMSREDLHDVLRIRGYL